MFQKTDFWIGLAVGAVAGIFGYRFMQEREQQLAPCSRRLRRLNFRLRNSSARRKSSRI